MRVIFKYVDELRLHWAVYANLSCIWDEKSALTPEMLVFKFKSNRVNYLHIVCTLFHES